MSAAFGQPFALPDSRGEFIDIVPTNSSNPCSFSGNQYDIMDGKQRQLLEESSDEIDTLTGMQYDG
jgi:hypothetical protein